MRHPVERTTLLPTLPLPAAALAIALPAANEPVAPGWSDWATSPREDRRPRSLPGAPRAGRNSLGASDARQGARPTRLVAGQPRQASPICRLRMLGEPKAGE